MEDLHDPVIHEDVLQGREVVDQDGVDNGRGVLCRQLHEAELGIIGALPQELRVDRKQLGARYRIDELLQSRFIRYVHASPSGYFRAALPKNRHCTRFPIAPS